MSKDHLIRNFLRNVRLREPQWLMIHSIINDPSILFYVNVLFNTFLSISQGVKQGLKFRPFGFLNFEMFSVRDYVCCADTLNRTSKFVKFILPQPITTPLYHLKFVVSNHGLVLTPYRLKCQSDLFWTLILGNSNFQISRNDRLEYQ